MIREKCEQRLWALWNEARALGAPCPPCDLAHLNDAQLVALGKQVSRQVELARVQARIRTLASDGRMMDAWAAAEALPHDERLAVQDWLWAFGNARAEVRRVRALWAEERTSGRRTPRAEITTDLAVLDRATVLELQERIAARVQPVQGALFEG
jgi:hypothetical protein